jgi:hypothetical protein
MPTFLSLPVEIRSMILGYAVAREIRVCGYRCRSTNHRRAAEHKSRLSGPNLNLLLVCRRVNQEVKSLDLRYRIYVGGCVCLDEVYLSLKPGLLARNQIVLSQIAFKPQSEVEKQPGRADYQSMFEIVGSSRHDWCKHGLYRTIHTEDSDEQLWGFPMLDFVLTF